MADSKIIIELIKRVQVYGDEKAKNQLLEIFYEDGCKWAKKLMSRIIYTNLINPTQGEIASLVYQAFEKAVHNIKVDRENSMSFKNFFFLLIKYQVYFELKNVLNYRVIGNFEEEALQIEQDFLLNSEEKNQLRKIHMEDKIKKICEFLCSKNIEYEAIVILKYQGYTNKEICKKLAFSEVSLKSRLQYIRRLVRNEFDGSWDF